MVHTSIITWQLNGLKKEFDCLLCQNLEASKEDIGSTEDWRKFGDPQKFAKFFKLGVYFTLLVDRFSLKQTKNQ